LAAGLGRPDGRADADTGAGIGTAVALIFRA
jgi:hypothetical protein